MKAEIYEPHTRKRFAEALHPGMTTVDVGANFGLYSLIAASQLKGEGRVYAFEPNPRIFPLLKANIESNDYTDIVHPEKKAISNECGSVELTVPKSFSGAGKISSSRRPRERDRNFYQFQVRTTTLDKFFKKQGWPKVDIIKMDIEGHEKYALEGMTELNRRNPQLQLFLEFGKELIEAAGTTAGALIATLRKMGFNSFYATECPEPRKLDLPEELPKLLKRVPENGSQMLWCLKE